MVDYGEKISDRSTYSLFRMPNCTRKKKKKIHCNVYNVYNEIKEMDNLRYKTCMVDRKNVKFMFFLHFPCAKNATRDIARRIMQTNKGEYPRFSATRMHFNKYICHSESNVNGYLHFYCKEGAKNHSSSHLLMFLFVVRTYPLCLMPFHVISANSFVRTLFLWFYPFETIKSKVYIWQKRKNVICICKFVFCQARYVSSSNNIWHFPRFHHYFFAITICFVHKITIFMREANSAREHFCAVIFLLGTPSPAYQLYHFYTYFSVCV